MGLFLVKVILIEVYEYDNPTNWIGKGPKAYFKIRPLHS